MRSASQIVVPCLLAASILLSGTGPLFSGRCGAAEPPGEGMDGARIAEWVQQLDSDQFVEREIATMRLIEAGGSVVQPLVSALEGESLEVTTRGIYVLRELALSNDLNVQDAAQTALEQVAQSESGPAARRAADTLNALAGIRQERAIGELRALGARLNDSVRPFGFQQAELLEVEIDAGFRGTPQDLRRLKWLTGVQRIRLEGERIGDECLEYVADMKNVSGLALKHTKVTDAGLAQLQGFQNLQELDIKYTPIGDAAAETLRQFKQLVTVKLYGTNMSRSAAEALQAALPQADVDFRRGAFLGVACDQPPMPCTVIQVVPNTGAAQAGIREGDVIVEYAGKRINDFDDLKGLIGTNEPGDSAELQVARGGSTIRRIVTGGADLGVAEGKTTPLGLEVQKVAEGSLAARSGIRGGDIIRRFDERPIDTVDTLNQVYKALGDDQQAFLEVSRDMQVVKVKVTFGEWQE